MTKLVTYDPFRDVDTGMDEMFRGFFRPVRWEGARTPVTIKMDVTETNDGYMVHAEMPGMKKENINIEIEGNQVTITGEVKRDWEKKEGDTLLRSERYYGNVFRSFTLPRELDEAKCEAKYDGGVLEMKLVARAGVEGKKLAIK
jgi:HSP20 family protein